MKLYSIVVTHYNQMEFIYEALDSVFKQNYPNIELIVTDDKSKSFDKKTVIDYIEKKKKKNITNYIIIANDTNLGTTKTLNKAIKKSNGDYIQFFAADDALYDENVITNFVNALENSEEFVVSSQCYLCGTTLDDKQGKYVPTKLAKSLNNKSAKEQYVEVAKRCLYGAGATAYKKEIFKKVGLFDESFKLVEDWSYYLLLTLNGYKIKYVDFVSFLHRSGGVSHYEKGDLPPHVRQYQNDILNIFEKLVLSQLDSLDPRTAGELFSKYILHVEMFSEKDQSIVQKKTPIIKKLKQRNKLLYIYILINKIMAIMHTQIFHTLMYIVFFTTLIDIFISYAFNLDYKYVLIHIISYVVALITIKVLKIIKRRLGLWVIFL